jgi:hypothetical protein
VNLTVTLQHLHLGVGLLSITANAVVGGTGDIDLDQLVQLAAQSFPAQISFPADGLASQSLPSSNGEGDLLLGARVTP